jgi:signal transduction histidine kinase
VTDLSVSSSGDESSSSQRPAVYPSLDYDIFEGGGEMGDLARKLDWSATPLGPPETWSQSLRSAVGILLTSRFSMWMGWGPDLAFLYNDSYRHATIGDKHPRAFARPAREVWSEIWEDVNPRLQHVLSTGIATWDEALLLFLERSGYAEETYHTFSYSPLRDDDGSLAGVFCVVLEETERVISQRRLATVRELASELATGVWEEEVLSTIERRLKSNSKDLPFALVYLFDDEGNARLVCQSGVDGDHPVAPTMIRSDAVDSVWPIADVREGAATQTITDLHARYGVDLPSGFWDRPPREAAICPIARQGQDRSAGFLVAALNPYRRYDGSYAGFVDLVALQISSGFANVHAYEQERSHAAALSEAAERERQLRHDAERARAEAEMAGAQLREVFMKAPANIAVLRGPTHIFESANPLYMELVRHRDIIGKPAAEALPEVVEQGFIALLDSVYRTGEPFVANEMHVSLQRPGLSEPEDLFLNFVYQPLRDLEGAVSGILAHAVDVTPQVVARQTIVEQALELQEANRAKSRFLATMSHELRTPLNAIIGYCDLLSAEISGRLTAGQTQQLARVDAAARHLLLIIEEILTFSRIEAGREQVHMQEVDIAEIVRETALLLEPLARGKSLAFSCTTPDTLPGHTDVGKLRQILLNLVGNAVKFTDAGKVSVDVRRDREAVVIVVRDTGIGISPAEHARVFEPFLQVRHSADRLTGGTGLGLAVTRELVQLLNGEITLQSEPGRGSEFSVRLPITQRLA